MLKLSLKLGGMGEKENYENKQKVQQELLTNEDITEDSCL